MARHLTFAEREVLQRMVAKKKSNSEIAALMNRHRSTIYRELSRNTTAFGYRPKMAQRMTCQRRVACHRRYKLKDLDLCLYVSERLRKAWSPDQIAGRLRRDFPHTPQRWVSAPTIYAWIQRSAPQGRRWLRRAHRWRWKRKKPPEIVSIRGRPRVINARRRYGDWEGDTVVGIGRRTGLVTLVERKSGLARIMKVTDRSSTTAISAIERCLRDLPSALRRSATFDNGPEFAEYDRLRRTLGLSVYFADPYCAWQRGSNESLNGLIRQYFPKRTDFQHVSRSAIQRVEQELNERPRRRFDYQAPLEVLGKRLCRI
jgi:transposase, IS30 family